MSDTKTRECPFCKEQILATATKCKHCLSFVAPEMPSHNGVCPYCKESINEKALVCKHCKSLLTTDLATNHPSRCTCSDTSSIATDIFKTVDPNAINQAIGKNDGCTTTMKPGYVITIHNDGSVTRTPIMIMETRCPIK